MEELGFTQTDLANSIGIHPSHVNHFVKARRVPSLYTFREICNALACSADWLLGLRDLTEKENTMLLKELQKEVGQWSLHNFGTQASYRPLLGAVEELGELAHAHLKQEQGIRPSDHFADKCDAIGDIIIYILDYCSKEGIDVEEELAVTWAKVKQRDWRQFPKNGITE